MLAVAFDFEMPAGKARFDVLLDLVGGRQHGDAPSSDS
jgi:hypothetical protein